MTNATPDFDWFLFPLTKTQDAEVGMFSRLHAAHFKVNQAGPQLNEEFKRAGVGEWDGGGAGGAPA